MDNDEITFDISSLIDNNITIDVSTIGGQVGDIHLNTMNNSIYIHNGNTWDTINVDSIDDGWRAVEWENSYPDFVKVVDMCKEYPGLEKAYENFKTIYKLVEQDWQGKQKERNNSSF
jgi:hypothetical protein